MRRQGRRQHLMTQRLMHGMCGGHLRPGPDFKVGEDPREGALTAYSAYEACD